MDEPTKELAAKYKVGQNTLFVLKEAVDIFQPRNGSLIVIKNAFETNKVVGNKSYDNPDGRFIPSGTLVDLAVGYRHDILSGSSEYFYVVPMFNANTRGLLEDLIWQHYINNGGREKRFLCYYEEDSGGIIGPRQNIIRVKLESVFKIDNYAGSINGADCGICFEIPPIYMISRNNLEKHTDKGELEMIDCAVDFLNNGQAGR